MRIYVDGDSCPVISEIITVAKERDLDVSIVKNINHVIMNDYAEIISVDPSSESADIYIANKVEKNDIVVSQDYGLAALVIPKDVKFITPNGLIINNTNLDTLLHHRFIASKLRKQKRYYGSKTKKRTKGDNRKFLNLLIKLLDKKT